MNQQYIIAIIVIFVVSLFLLFGIFFILFKNFKYKDMLNTLKRRFNRLTFEDFTRKNIPIDHIGFSNMKNEPISTLFNTFSYHFENELSKTKSNLYKMTSTLKHYDWKNFKYLYSSVSKDINSLENSLDNINELYLSILQYRNYISFVIISYRLNTKNVIDFYEKNLGVEFDNLVIKNFVSKLKKHCENLNNYIEEPQLNEIVSELESFDNDFMLTFNLLSNLYIRSKQHRYINSTVQEIENVLKNNYNDIPIHDVNDTNKTLTKVHKNINTLNKKINKHDFDTIDEIIKYIISEILKIKKKLQLNFTSNEFLSKNREIVVNNFNDFINESKKIYGFLNKIYSNFYNDDNIKKEISNLKVQYEILLKSCSIFLSKNRDSKQDTTELFITSRKIIEDMVEWSQWFERILKDISNKYVYFKKVFNGIASSKLLLAQMLAFANSNNLSISTKNDIQKISSDLNNIELTFSNEYDKEFQYNYNKLLDLEHSIRELNIVLASSYNKKMYVEKLIYYANTLITNHNFNINLSHVGKLYLDNNYDESLSVLIKELRPYRYKSSKIISK